MQGPPMDWFRHRDGALWCEDVPLAAVAARVGTPAYVYSARTLAHHVEALRAAFAPADPLICYAVKANGNLAVLRRLLDAGT
ncbi:MAG: diaminopimelate decarboxylase, partial [Candidatus Krumholzibacteriia bacterium]